MVLPSFSGRLATSTAALTAAPLLMPGGQRGAAGREGERRSALGRAASQQQHAGALQPSSRRCQAHAPTMTPSSSASRRAVAIASSLDTCLHAGAGGACGKGSRCQHAGGGAGGVEGAGSAAACGSGSPRQLRACTTPLRSGTSRFLGTKPAPMPAAGGWWAQAREEAGRGRSSFNSGLAQPSGRSSSMASGGAPAGRTLDLVRPGVAAADDWRLGGLHRDDLPEHRDQGVSACSQLSCHSQRGPRLPP